MDSILNAIVEWFSSVFSFIPNLFNQIAQSLGWVAQLITFPISLVSTLQVVLDYFPFWLGPIIGFVISILLVKFIIDLIKGWL